MRSAVVAGHILINIIFSSHNSDINKYNIKLYSVTYMECDYKFRLQLALIKSAPSITIRNLIVQSEHNK